MVAVIDPIILDPEKSDEIVAGHPRRKRFQGQDRALPAPISRLN
jgi:hypothetical protein